MRAKNRILIFSIGLAALLNSCSSAPEKALPVRNFDAGLYLGTWYEMARLDYRFERDLNNVSAQYSLGENGNINVLNSGFNFKKKAWEKAEGRAKFREKPDIAALKVSFFGPFYSGYNVVALDENYQYALVAGKNLDYLWILSRTKDIPQEVKMRYLNIAKGIGYNTDGLIWVKHDRSDNPFLNTK